MYEVFYLDHRTGYFDVQESAAVAEFDKVRTFEFKKVVLLGDNGCVSDGPIGDVFYKALGQAASFPDTREIAVKDTISRVGPVAVSVKFYRRGEGIEHAAVVRV